MDWRVVAEYEDRESGTKDRPQFKAMMDAASRREFDTVLVWSLDRFSREGIGKTFDHLRRLGSYGVKFRSYSESFLDTTAECGELVAAIFAFVASFERRRIAERIVAGLARARAEGTVLGRPRVPVNRTKVWRMADQGKSMRDLRRAGVVPRNCAAGAGGAGEINGSDLYSAKGRLPSQSE